MPLSRIDEMLRVLKMDFAELARKVADAQPLRRELTLDAGDGRGGRPQAAAAGDLLPEPVDLRADRRAPTRFSDAECVKYLVQLDQLGIIELRPLNRYRLKVAKGFRWRAERAGDAATSASTWPTTTSAAASTAKARC